MKLFVFVGLAFGTFRALHGAPPPYPLTAICAGLPNAAATLSDLAHGSEAVTESIGQTRLIYSSDNLPLRATRDARNAAHLTTPILVYMGGLTTNSDDVLALEEDFRSGIAMTPAAALTAALDSTGTTFAVTAADLTNVPIKASTVEKSAVEDARKFNFWIRIDDELMRVTAYSDGKATVERGYDKSNAAPHAAGALVFAPVYLGNKNQLDAARHSNSYPGRPDPLRYALDPGSPAAAAFKATIVSREIKAGYDGAWFDTFQPVPYNLCDAQGNKVSYFWDFAHGKVYNFETYLEAIKRYVPAVRWHTKESTGRNPILFANSATASYARGVKTLFNHGDIKDLMDGYCFEDSYLKVQATRATGKKGADRATFVSVMGDKWLGNIEHESDAATQGLNAFCMAGPAGYLAAFINPDQENYEELARFAYGSFLLTVTKERTTSFGWPLIIGGSHENPGVVPWPKVIFSDLGNPLQSNHPAELRWKDSRCYIRRFERGLVAVNSGEAAAHIVLPSPYNDPTTQTTVTEMDLASGDARILFNATP